MCSTASSSRSMAASCVGISPARSTYACAWSSASVSETSCTVQSCVRTRTHGSRSRLNSIVSILILLLIGQAVLTVVVQHLPGKVCRVMLVQ